ncbi:hypothetical protein MKW92_048179 [Papaver armeniacum]|nr:hypothetical protein MKW92_048179 [Papaver armeniacum]
MNPMGISTMKPCCKILISCCSKTSFFFGFSIPKSQNPSSVLRSYRKLHSCSDDNHHQQIVAIKRLIFQKPISNSSWGGQSRVFSNCCNVNKFRGFSVITNVASDIRHNSTSSSSSVEGHVNEKGFERIYIHGGINLNKPLVEGVEVKDKRVIIEEAEEKQNPSLYNSSVQNTENIKNFRKKDLSEIEKEAWDLLRESVVEYCGSPVGTVAANNPNDKVPLNYDQVFIRDFVPSALAFYSKEMEKLLGISFSTLCNCRKSGYPDGNKIDFEFMSNRWFDMFPTLLVTDGSCMIDRRMGIHGHPLEIQALFYSALRSSREMLTVDEGSKNLVRAVNNRLSALSFHIREYYWVDMKKINEIYRYKTEEYSTDAINKFNIYPDQIPSWLVDWIPDRGGYLIGNLQPAHMDFRFFTLGNLWSIISSLGTPRQNQGILNLMEDKWEDLIGHMPLKICYPALEYDEWRIITGSDPKNTPWSYHNGGSWPTLMWQFTLACIKMGRPGLAEKAVALVEKRISEDKWPEYYDTRTGKFIGKQSRLYQTWTIAGYLTSKMLLENPEMASLLTWNEDLELLETCICALTNTSRKKCSRRAAKSQILI